MNLSSWLFGVLFAEPQKARLNQQTKHVEVLGDCLSDAGSIPAVSTKIQILTLKAWKTLNPPGFFEPNYLNRKFEIQVSPKRLRFVYLPLPFFGLRFPISDF